MYRGSKKSQQTLFLNILYKTIFQCFLWSSNILTLQLPYEQQAPSSGGFWSCRRTSPIDWWCLYSSIKGHLQGGPGPDRKTREGSEDEYQKSWWAYLFTQHQTQCVDTICNHQYIRLWSTVTQNLNCKLNPKKIIMTLN